MSSHSFVTEPRCSNGGDAIAPNSSASHPAPTPTKRRPPERTSIVASIFAVKTGFRYGSTSTLGPKRIVSVPPARKHSMETGSR